VHLALHLHAQVLVQVGLFGRHVSGRPFLSSRRQ
jgi:hypothetical protein